MLYKLGVIKEQVLSFEEVVEQRKKKAVEDEHGEHGEDEGEEENKKENSKNVTHHTEARESAELGLKVIETPEIKLANEWKYYFSGIKDVEKDLKDIPDNASNAFCITLFFTHQDIDNLS